MHFYKDVQFYGQLFYSAKQNELQEDYYAVEAKRAELQRIMDAEGKPIISMLACLHTLQCCDSMTVDT